MPNSKEPSNCPGFGPKKNNDPYTIIEPGMPPNQCNGYPADEQAMLAAMTIMPIFADNPWQGPPSAYQDPNFQQFMNQPCQNQRASGGGRFMPKQQNIPCSGKSPQRNKIPSSAAGNCPPMDPGFQMGGSPCYEDPDPCSEDDGYVHGQVALSEFQCPEAQPFFDCGKDNHLIAKYPELQPNFQCQMQDPASNECPDFKPKPKRVPCNMTCFPPDTYFYEEKIKKPKKPKEPAYLTCYKIEYSCDASSGAMKALRDKTKKIPKQKDGPLQKFIPSYEKEEKKPNFCRIMTNDYQKTWISERDELKDQMYPRAPIPMYNIRLIPCQSSTEQSRFQKIANFKKQKKPFTLAF